MSNTHKIVFIWYNLKYGNIGFLHLYKNVIHQDIKTDTSLFQEMRVKVSTASNPLHIHCTNNISHNAVLLTFFSSCPSLSQLLLNALHSKHNSYHS